MSKQKVMDDLDALLADLQLTSAEHPRSQTVIAKLGEHENNSKYMSSEVDTAIILTADSEPLYEMQSLRTPTTHANNSSSVVGQQHAVHKKDPISRHSNTYHLEAHQSVATLGSNLTELDSLLQELSSAQFSVEVDRRSAAEKDAFVVPYKNSQHGLSNGGSYHLPNAGHIDGTGNVAVASTATRELDELMASLNTMNSMNVGTAHASVVSPQTSNNAVMASASSMNNGINLNSLMDDLDRNMTQHGVNTVPKGHCAACVKPIVGQVVMALGRLWHPEHFTCVKCHEPLGTRNFFERDAVPYCERDYHLLFSPQCASCGGPILDKCITAIDKTWHPEHFCCLMCGHKLGSEGFHEHDGQPYCQEDYFEHFAPKCGGCSRPIVENFISALNRQWHPPCFVCTECRIPFGTGTFFEHEGMPYCETHFHAQRGSLCAGCHKPVTGRCITAMYRKYHPEHFVCTFCQRQLNKGTFKEENDKPYCHPCFVRLFS